MHEKPFISTAEFAKKIYITHRIIATVFTKNLLKFCYHCISEIHCQTSEFATIIRS
jgi:hypothetical protein